MDRIQLRFNSNVEPLRRLQLTIHTCTAQIGVVGALFGCVLGGSPLSWKISLKGATMMDQMIVREGNRQIFITSEHLQETQKEDLAWGTFVLLKNTKSMAVVLSQT